MNTSFDDVWMKLQTRLEPGTIVRNWTVLKGYLGDTMSVVQIDQHQVIIKAPKAKNLQFISRTEFEVIWKKWDKYISGQLQRKEIRDLTFHSKYIISILHWLENI